ncbi:MAG TPA: hypothetical protein VJH75_02110, partial [Patescibacteria group bacterium]|nr:hypothetical protein [Patescibacteria group bacterium]
MDDLTNDGQQMVEAATKLITDIKRRIGSAAGNSIFFATMVLVGAIIWMFFHGAEVAWSWTYFWTSLV